MNILYISSGITFGRDKYKYGLTFTYRTLKALNMHSNKITLICLAEFDEKNAESFQLLNELCSDIILVKKKVFNRRLLHRMLRIYCFIANTLIEMRPSRSLQMRDKIKSMDRPDLFDLTIYDGYDLVQYADCIKKLSKILYLSDSITLRAQEALKSSSLSIINRMEFMRWMNKIKNFEKHNYTSFAKCIVAAERDKDTILQLNPKVDITVLPFSVDTEYFKKKGTENKDIILFVGILWTEPNVDAINYFCNEIFPLIRKKNKDVILLLLGGAVKKEIKRLPIKDPKIKLIDFVEDVRPYLDRATVFISPMRIGSGMNNKVLEAMSMSKAIVTTEYGNRGIGLIDGWDSVVCRDKYKFAESVIELLEDKEKREFLGRNARIKAEKEFSTDTYSHRLNAIIESVKNSSNGYAPYIVPWIK